MRAILLLVQSCMVLGLLSQELMRQNVETRSGDIRDIGQMASGHLVFLSSEGLSRSDGQEEIRFWTRRSDAPNYSSMSISAEGRLAIASTTGDIKWGYLDSLYLELDLDVPISEISYHQGRLVVASQGRGLLLMDADTTYHVRIGTEDYLNDLSTHGRRLFALSDHDILIWEDGRSERIDLPDGWIGGHLAVDSDTLLLHDINGRFAYCDLKSKTWTELEFELDGVRSVQCVGDEFLIHARDGLFKTRRIDAERVMTEGLIDSRDISSVFVDDEGVVWYADAEGLWKAHSRVQRWSVPGETLILDMEVMLGDLFLLTQLDLIQWNWESSRSFRLPEETSGFSVLTSLDDALVLGGTDQGLHLFDPSTGNWSILDSTRMTVLDLLWAGSGLHVSTLEGIRTYIREDGGWKQSKEWVDSERFYNLGLSIDSSDKLYAITDRNGLIGYDAQGHRVLRVEDGQMDRSFQQVIAHPDLGILAISARSGLFSVHEGALAPLESPHGVWPKLLSCAVDSLGRVILEAEDELSIYDPVREELVSYGLSGLGISRDRATLGISAFYEDHFFCLDGHSIYTLDCGLSQFRLEPLLSWRTMEVGLEEVSFAIVDFSEDRNDMRFGVDAILNRNPERSILLYRLTGLDEGWRRTKEGVMDYPNLPPGEYTLEVGPSHDLNRLPMAQLSYSFSIRPFFYNTLWFRSMVLVLFILMLAWYFQRMKHRARLKSENELLKARSQLEGLKAQLNPHFLFNSFNTIIGLIEESPRRSIHFVEHLTTFYRQVLKISEMELVDIEDELAMLEDYRQILRMRFEGMVDLQVSKGIYGFRIPPMSLQLLVENAIKHNRFSEHEPLRIRVYLEGDRLVVENRMDIRSLDDMSSTGLGLRNISQRYRILADKEPDIQKVDGFFRVSLPKLGME